MPRIRADSARALTRSATAMSLGRSMYSLSSETHELLVAAYDRIVSVGYFLSTLFRGTAYLTISPFLLNR